MRPRDRLEQIVRGWDDAERKAGRDPVIDFDCAPDVVGEPPSSRFDTLQKLQQLRDEADDAEVLVAADAHVAYLGAVLGERSDLKTYIRRTQGCTATGWTPEYVQSVGEIAQRALADVDVTWDGHAKTNLDQLSPSVPAAEAGERIRDYADRFEPAVRELTGATTDYELAVETVKVDAYWAYWLDGEGTTARLRINEAQAAFTEIDTYRFALHEVLGHALQYANLTTTAAASDVSWPRQLVIHGPHQTLFEGLAQVLALAASPRDALVRAWTRLAHYLQLVQAELHVMVNAGSSASACREHASSRVPFWNDDEVASILRDRTLDPALRSYLWSYPAGIDWFLAVHDAGGSLLAEVLHAAYQRPLDPRDLERLWPAGPRIGGNA